MEFRTLACAALGLALAGAAISFEVALVDFWAPMALGIIGLVFALGAIGAAREEGESPVIPYAAVLLAGWAIVQGLSGMNELTDARDQVDSAQDGLEQIVP